MRPEDLASQLYAVIVQGNTKLYSEILQNTERKDASDQYWRLALQFYDSLGEEQRRVLISVMRQVTIDAISSMLAIVDGTTPLEAPFGTAHIMITSEASGTRLSGHLQDLFLALVESEARPTG